MPGNDFLEFLKEPLGLEVLALEDDRWSQHLP